MVQGGRANQTISVCNNFRRGIALNLVSLLLLSHCRYRPPTQPRESPAFFFLGGVVYHSSYSAYLVCDVSRICVSNSVYLPYHPTVSNGNAWGQKNLIPDVSLKVGGLRCGRENIFPYISLVGVWSDAARIAMGQPYMLCSGNQYSATNINFQDEIL